MYCVGLYSRFNKLENDPKILLGKASDALLASPRFSTEGGLEIKKTDSTTVKSIAELYLLATVSFYRTAIIFLCYISSMEKAFASKVYSPKSLLGRTLIFSLSFDMLIL